MPSEKKVNLIDAGRRELYHIDKKMNNFQSIVSSLITTQTHKGPITDEALSNVSSMWFIGPQKDITPEESLCLENFIIRGGNILVFASKLTPVFDAFIKKYGITLGEPVISPTYITYIDPHEVTVQHGIINRSLNNSSTSKNLTFAYPYGSTLEISIPAVPILGSGKSSYPLNRPIIGFTRIGADYASGRKQDSRTLKGSLTVIGSPHMFCDEWLPKENNSDLLNFLINLSITGKATLNEIDASHPDYPERWYTPDVMSMSERLRPCIQESEKNAPQFYRKF